MTAPASALPAVVFGEVAVSAPLAEPKRAGAEFRELCRIKDRIALYQTGRSREIVVRPNSRDFLLLYGRVYAPRQVDGYRDGAADMLPELFAAGPAKIEMSGILLSIRRADSGPELHLWADKYGLHPLFFFRDGGRLVFATHMSGLRVLLGNRLPGIAENGLLHYYHFGFTPNDRTLLEGVRKLPPGHRLDAAGGNISVTSYFAANDLFRPGSYTAHSEAEICDAIDTSIESAIRRRIPTGGPAGIALSGGVDSGYIVQKLVQTGAPVLGYNLAYAGYYSEADRVDFLARKLDLTVRRIVVTPEQVLENFTAANAVTSEPVGFNNATLRLLADVAAADGVTTLFDGDGADRLFLGMNRYLQYQKAFTLYRFLKPFGLVESAATLLGLFPNDDLRKLGFHFRNWRAGIPPYPERDMSGTAAYDRSHERKVYDLAIGRLAGRFGASPERVEFGPLFTLAAIEMCPEMFFHAPAELQGSMGLFATPAFWDDDLVSLAISLATAWKLRDGKTKYILRKAAARNLDPEYWMLPKIGLQSSQAFAMQSGLGQTWYAEQIRRIADSDEYRTLQGLLPGGRANPDRLIDLMAWNDACR